MNQTLIFSLKCYFNFFRFLSLSPTLQQQMGIDQSDDSSDEGSDGGGIPNGFIVRRADFHDDDVMDSDDDDDEEGGGGRGSLGRCTQQ
jgi:hypothetical protein